MTGGTIHRRAFGLDAFDCFDGGRRIRSQYTHFTRDLLLRFFVRLPLVGIVTMPATHTQRLAVANIHDGQGKRPADSVFKNIKTFKGVPAGRMLHWENLIVRWHPGQFW